MKDGALVGLNNKATKAAMEIGQKPCAPMIARCERNANRPELDPLPIVQFVYDLKTKVVDQIAHADRNDNRLAGRDTPQGPSIKMIEVRMSHENEINCGQMMDLKAGLLQALDHLQPHRPVRINQNVKLACLNQERRVPNPGNTDLTLADFGEERARAAAGTLRK